MSWLPENMLRLDADALDRFFVAQRAITTPTSPFFGAPPALQAEVRSALDAYRRASTNVASSATKEQRSHEITSSFDALLATMQKVPGLVELFFQLKVDQTSSNRGVGRRQQQQPDAQVGEPRLLDEIVPGVFVGSVYAAVDEDLLRECGVTRVVRCIQMDDKGESEQQTLSILNIASDDLPDYNIRQHFDAAFDFIEAGLGEGHGVLVHCVAGISRSATIAAAYLVRKLGISAEEAVGRVRKARPSASPNPGFSQQLRDYANTVLSTRYGDASVVASILAAAEIEPSSGSLQPSLRVPCPVCNRNFDSAVLPRHQAICEKNAAKAKRPVFEPLASRRLMDEVAPNLFVGSVAAAADAAYLKTHGVTHVCCCISMDPRHPLEFSYHSFVAEDEPEYDLSAHFVDALEFIDKAITGGGKVLVHCVAGASRSASIAAAYLVRQLRISPEEAVERLRAARSCVNPNPGFLRQLDVFAKSQRREDGNTA